MKKGGRWGMKTINSQKMQTAKLDQTIWANLEDIGYGG